MTTLGALVPVGLAVGVEVGAHGVPVRFETCPLCRGGGVMQATLCRSISFAPLFLQELQENFMLAHSCGGGSPRSWADD